MMKVFPLVLRVKIHSIHEKFAFDKLSELEKCVFEDKRVSLSRRFLGQSKLFFLITNALLRAFNIFDYTKNF